MEYDMENDVHQPKRDDNLESKVADLHRAIYGNGEPASGLLWRIKTIEKTVEVTLSVVVKLAWLFVGTFVTGISGLFILLLTNK